MDGEGEKGTQTANVHRSMLPRASQREGVKANAAAENAPDVAPPYAPGKISRADMQGSERTVTVDSIADLIPGVRGAHGPDGMEGCAQPPALPSSLSSPSPTSTDTFGAIGVRAAASTAAAEDAAAAEMAGAAAHACDADAAMQPSGAAKEAHCKVRPELRSWLYQQLQ